MTVERTNGSAPLHGVIREFRRPATPPGGVRDTGGADTAAITADARRVNDAAPVIEGSPEVRTDRVLQLKAAIADGAYESDAREVARRLLARGL